MPSVRDEELRERALGVLRGREVAGDAERALLQEHRARGDVGDGGVAWAFALYARDRERAVQRLDEAGGRLRGLRAALAPATVPRGVVGGRQAAPLVGRRGGLEARPRHARGGVVATARARSGHDDVARRRALRGRTRDEDAVATGRVSRRAGLRMLGRSRTCRDRARVAPRSERRGEENARRRSPGAVDRTRNAERAERNFRARHAFGKSFDRATVVSGVNRTGRTRESIGTPSHAPITLGFEAFERARRPTWRAFGVLTRAFDGHCWTPRRDAAARAPPILGASARSPWRRA